MATPVPNQQSYYGATVDEKKAHGLDLEAASLSEGKPAANALHVERAQLLANLPDPDADKTPEERAVIVGQPLLEPTDDMLTNMTGPEAHVESRFGPYPLAQSL